MAQNKTLRAEYDIKNHSDINHNPQNTDFPFIPPLVVIPSNTLLTFTYLSQPYYLISTPVTHIPSLTSQLLPRFLQYNSETNKRPRSNTPAPPIGLQSVQKKRLLAQNRSPSHLTISAKLQNPPKLIFNS